MGQHQGHTAPRQRPVQVAQRLDARGVEHDQAVHLEHDGPGAGGQQLGQRLELADSAEEQAAVELVGHHAVRQRLARHALQREQLAHAVDEEQAGRHQANLHGHREVGHHGEREGAQQQRAVGEVEAAQPRELVPVAHVPGHDEQDAGQGSQRHMHRQRCRQQQHQQQRGGMHHAGHRAGGAGADVGDGAGNGAGGRQAAEQRRSQVGDALGHQLLVGVVAGQVGRELVGHAGAQQRFDRAQQRQRQRRDHELAHAGPVHVGPGERRQGPRDAAEAAADGLQRQGQPRGGKRGAGQRDDGARQQCHRPAPAGEWPVGRDVLGPEQHHGHAGDGHRGRGRVQRRGVVGHRPDLAEEVGRHLGDPQPEQVLQLGQRDQHGDAVGEAGDDGHRDIAHQAAELEGAHCEQQHAGAHRCDQQIGQAVALQDAVDHDDEGARRPADLHAGAAQQRDQEAGDDGRGQALLGPQTRGDGEGQCERQRDDADRQAGAQVGEQLLAAVAPQQREAAGAEGVKLGQGHGLSGRWRDAGNVMPGGPQW
mmetsp:Transcript_7068/g.30130  ORF Transcript_7068/g.30130 Transcript_7068/m.30130 type:complete len:536 (+) Transcript_7068:2183-3790(+)